MYTCDSRSKYVYRTFWVALYTTQSHQRMRVPMGTHDWINARQNDTSMTQLKQKVV